MIATSDFLARFPEFEGTPVTLIEQCISEAYLELDPSVWNAALDTGAKYLAAHKIALSPFGIQAKLVSKMGDTTYNQHFQQLVKKVAFGFRSTGVDYDIGDPFNFDGSQIGPSGMGPNQGG